MRYLIIVLGIISLFACNEDNKVITPKYMYRLQQFDYNGESQTHNIVTTSNARINTEDIIINSYTEYGSFSIDNKDISLIVNDTLVIKGDLLLKNFRTVGISINGVLIITGACEIKNKGIINNKGNVYVKGLLSDKNKSIIKNDNHLYLCSVPELKSAIQGNDYMDNLDLHTPKITLTCNNVPIVLKSFTVARIGSEDIIKFCTTSETNSDYVVIQRSIDGINFKNVVSIKTNSPNGNCYEYKSSLN